MKRKMSLFYKVYITLILIFAVCLIGFSIFLLNFVKEYNEGLAETVSSNFFNDTFLDKDIEKIIDLSNESPNEFETNEHIFDYYNSLLSTDLSYTSVTNTAGNDDKKYVVKSEQTPIMFFTLSPDKNGDYKYKSLEVIPRRNEIKIKVLNSTMVYINGIFTSPEYITERTPFKNTHYLPEDVQKPEWVTYTIPGFTAEPQITFVDRNGLYLNPVEVDGVLVEDIVYSDGEEDIKNYILEAAKQYAKCMQNDAPKGTALQYYKKDTDLYNNFRTSETTFVWDHHGYDFEDVSVSEFFRYDENIISVRVSFTHILKMRGKEDYRDMVDITFFAENIDGKYMIFAQHNNVAGID